MFESWPELWGCGYSGYRTTLRKFLWFRTVTGGNAPQYDTVIGRIVSFLTQRIAPLKIEADLSPIQDLHGQDAPWPPGGGKNKISPTIHNLAVSSGVVVSNADYRSLIAEVTGGETYMLSRDVISGNRFRVYGTETVPSEGVHVTNIAISASFDSALSLQLDIPSGIKYILVYLANDESTITSKIQLELGTTVTSFSPYSNECPISGHTGAEVYVEDEYDAQATPTVSISFGQTVYGGQLTVNEDGSGSVVAEWAELAVTTVGGTSTTINGLTCVSLVCTDLKTDANKTNVISSAFKLLGTTAIDMAVGGMINRTGQFYNLSFCLPDQFTTLEEFRTWASTNNLKVLYKFRARY